MAQEAYNIKDVKGAGIKFTGHSFQVGAAVVMHCNGTNEVEIKQPLRWASDVYKLYLRKMPQNAINHHMRLCNGTDVDCWVIDFCTLHCSNGSECLHNPTNTTTNNANAGSAFQMSNIFS
jgi:hypothetical protein